MTSERAERNEGEPVAWAYELATFYDTKTGEYSGWSDRLTKHKPVVQPAAIKALTPLFAHPSRPKEGETTWRSILSACFECGHELHAPFCPACNPEMVPKEPVPAAPVSELMTPDEAKRRMNKAAELYYDWYREDDYDVVGCFERMLKALAPNEGWRPPEGAWKAAAKVLLRSAREYVSDALDAHEHTDGRDLLRKIDEALSAAPAVTGEKK